MVNVLYFTKYNNCLMYVYINMCVDCYYNLFDVFLYILDDKYD